MNVCVTFGCLAAMIFVSIIIIVHSKTVCLKRRLYSFQEKNVPFSFICIPYFICVMKHAEFPRLIPTHIHEKTSIFMSFRAIITDSFPPTSDNYALHFLLWKVSHLLLFYSFHGLFMIILCSESFVEYTFFVSTIHSFIHSPTHTKTFNWNE